MTGWALSLSVLLEPLVTVGSRDAAILMMEPTHNSLGLIGPICETLELENDRQRSHCGHRLNGSMDYGRMLSY